MHATCAVSAIQRSTARRVASSLWRAAVPARSLPYFVDLGGSSIWDANEAFYVETPREMMERGDYISPTFNYQPRFNKPVLSYWIVAGFYKVFGVSVGVQRLPIALGAVAMIFDRVLPGSRGSRAIRTASAAGAARPSRRCGQRPALRSRRG